MAAFPSPERIAEAYEISRQALLAQRNDCGYWSGELSTSALSTATAVMALQMMNSGRKTRDEGHQSPRAAARGLHRLPPVSLAHPSSLIPHLSSLIEGGLAWLAEHQNGDGGWGDTTRSKSNISTTMLAHAVFHATATAQRYSWVVGRAKSYIDRAGGVPAVISRYGKDRTFSAPILTHCALAGLVDWDDVLPLPFELACMPARFYKTVRLPVVSYALPALIAVGQVRHHHRPPRNPVTRLLRNRSIGRSLTVLERIQPSNGGFLEATPLTSFVTMSLAGMGLVEHPVAQRGLRFLMDSVRPDGSWPIDTNLATWVTTLSVNALGDGLPEDDRPAIRVWLLGQQYRQEHPYTSADPGGWAWTNLPGGVPDVDDTSGAILALLKLSEVRDQRSEIRGQWSIVSGGQSPRMAIRGTDESDALSAAVQWLLDLQNRDGGWPTFCRGWGTLPFDRSAPDLTAHALRALVGWLKETDNRIRRRSDKETVGRIRRTDAPAVRLSPRWSPAGSKAHRAIAYGFRYLERSQRADGSWLPLWFGNQHGCDDENPTYGTARVLAAYRDAGRLDTPAAQRGLAWLRATQNPDGGWGGAAGISSSVEETALAVEALLSNAKPDETLSADSSAGRGLAWLLERVEDGTFREPTPIGFYFAKLWYFEHLYPLIFTVAALGRARRILSSKAVGWALSTSQKRDVSATGGPSPPYEFQQGVRRVDSTQ